MYNFCDVLCYISIVFSYIILVRANGDIMIPLLSDDANVTDVETQEFQYYNNTGDNLDDSRLFTDEKDDLERKDSRQRRLKDIVIMTKYEKANPINNPCTEITTRSPFTYDNLVSIYKKNKIIIIIVAIVVAQLCVLLVAGYFYRSGCQCARAHGDAPTQRKPFNRKHHVVSMTTPLICTSKSDTETTEYEYHNVHYDEKNMKQYNTMQYSESRSVKEIQVSDDFINNCKNRRNWRQANSDRIAIKETDDNVNEGGELSFFKCINNDERNNSVRQETIDIHKVSEKCDFGKVEQILQCHSYTAEGGCRGRPQNVIEAAPVAHMDAQAYFSDDTIDKIITDINEENSLSDCYSSESQQSNILSDGSSKIANNRFRRMSKYFRTKLGCCTKSDPGVGSNDLQLLHLSPRSSYSSSDNTETCLRTITIKRSSDSRTSL